MQQDDSPSRIAAGYVMTFLAGNAGYVLHAGPGIRGGGAADVSSELRRHAHFDELPSFKPIAAALGAAKQYLPPGLANWTRHAPKRGDRSASRVRSVCTPHRRDDVSSPLAVGIEKPVTVRAHVARRNRNQGAGDGKGCEEPEGRLRQTSSSSAATRELVIIGRGT